MIPALIGFGIYEVIGLTVRHFYFPREPIQTSMIWPIVVVLGRH